MAVLITDLTRIKTRSISRHKESFYNDERIDISISNKLKIIQNTSNQSPHPEETFSLPYTYLCLVRNNIKSIM